MATRCPRPLAKGLLARSYQIQSRGNYMPEMAMLESIAAGGPPTIAPLLRLANCAARQCGRQSPIVWRLQIGSSRDVEDALDLVVSAAVEDTPEDLVGLLAAALRALAAFLAGASQTAMRPRMAQAAMPRNRRSAAARAMRIRASDLMRVVDEWSDTPRWVRAHPEIRVRLCMSMQISVPGRGLDSRPHPCGLRQFPESFTVKTVVVGA